MSISLKSRHRFWDKDMLRLKPERESAIDLIPFGTSTNQNHS